MKRYVVAAIIVVLGLTVACRDDHSQTKEEAPIYVPTARVELKDEIKLDRIESLLAEGEKFEILENKITKFLSSTPQDFADYQVQGKKFMELMNSFHDEWKKSVIDHIENEIDAAQCIDMLRNSKITDRLSFGRLNIGRAGVDAALFSEKKYNKTWSATMAVSFRDLDPESFTYIPEKTNSLIVYRVSCEKSHVVFLQHTIK